MQWTRQRAAYAYALLAVMLWSTVASAFKLTLGILHPAELLLFANLVSAAALLVILLGQRRLGLLRAFSGRDLARCASLGLLNPFLYYLVLFRAYDLLPAQEAQPLNYTWAITLALLSIPLLKQRIGLRSILALLVSYAGVLVIATRGNLLSLEFSNPTGVLLALGSTVLWSLYWIYNTSSQRDPVASLLLNFSFSLPWVLVVNLVVDGRVRLPPAAGLLGATYVGLFEMGLTFVLWLKALRLSSSTAKVSNLIFFSPFLSLVFIHFLVGEAIRASTLVGLVLIVAGNVLQQIGKN